jgi:hypothetical protein
MFREGDDMGKDGFARIARLAWVRFQWRSSSFIVRVVQMPAPRFQ